ITAADAGAQVLRDLAVGRFRGPRVDRLHRPSLASRLGCCRRCDAVRTTTTQPTAPQKEKGCRRTGRRAVASGYRVTTRAARSPRTGRRPGRAAAATEVLLKLPGDLVAGEGLHVRLGVPLLKFADVLAELGVLFRRGAYALLPRRRFFEEFRGRHRQVEHFLDPVQQ